jgi:hypothetical protein
MVSSDYRNTTVYNVCGYLNAAEANTMMNHIPTPINAVHVILHQVTQSRPMPMHQDIAKLIGEGIHGPLSGFS